MTFFKKPKKLTQVLQENQEIKEQNAQNNTNQSSSQITAQNHIQNEEDEIVVEEQMTIEELIAEVKKPFSNTQDMVTHWINLPSDDSKIVFLFLDSIIDKSILKLHILNPFFELKKDIDLLSFEQIAGLELKKQTDFTLVPQLLLQSNALVFTQDTSCYYSILAPLNTQRDIKEPDNEAIIRGSHEGFIESMTMNLALIRKQLKTPKLTIKYFKLGSETHTNVALVYVENIANPDLVREVERRITSIDAEAVYTLGNVEESIEDKPFSFFPQMLSTERPDRVAANMMEGRVALVYDTSPTAHVLPVNFFTFYQSVDDYNKRWHIGSFFRAIRLFSFFIAIGLPAVYIATVSFHFEIIPFNLILLVKGSLEDIPYPPLFEAMLMELTIELIREASIRLPTRIGTTIAIVGGLVIGDAVVKAGLVSNLMIIVVAITAIAAYIVPSNEMSAAVRILRFPFMLAAATLGFLGIVFGFIVLLFHLCKLYTFGSPYFAPLAPFKIDDMKDAIIRLPFWKQNKRPNDASPLKRDQANRTRKWDRN
ncbi:spore germination protein KA [Fictibacillus barbaricus]|uniref:Spore germination protein KA n=2 Tax=Fictibacillus barbaricus TaxID=182136 RepID=A0ABU1TXQ5_9BACL|nr:spore germination protein [Fictibacillus barbaricus]MDR7071945.1 spore germination protein KA [Fictibacillus barbaricus]